MSVSLVKFHERDLGLPKYRKQLLDKALDDLINDTGVMAVFEGGSLARGNYDLYSDIDLHVIVNPGMQQQFIESKRARSAKWGAVLFYEESSPVSPVIVTHYEGFVKVDSWYQVIEDITPSIWLQDLQVYYDPYSLLTPIFEEAEKLKYTPDLRDIEWWRGKVFAFLHEAYRSTMRGEMYSALSNIDRLRWLIAYGWYMEIEIHLKSSYGVWSKIEGTRSQLKDWQQVKLAEWDCRRDQKDILETIANLSSEFYQLNVDISKKFGIHSDEERCRRIIEMII
ncbi:hypothetical protein NCCP2222_17700 [Sporosarcina sp. NCCP-2222]|uniref:nucleotidyltransferase domain-containing protein n=1 Tax=Sporosarcina sp. NCCP-2222 TaxID=2935073 RepID=UPI0020844E9A|nr:nucleotidyltransferase domain-containing protein [Sporosarcina sp. NCCP-2222]GKV55823.1 hypothetical protein NCCP2222_17700 [Sporosarcina sp. NCCP-2222]